MRFTKSYRLLKSGEYDFVFQHKKKISKEPATLYISVNSLQHARLGLLISKRAIKTAVARNRIKRLVRESFRQHVQQLKAYDIIFVARTCVQYMDNKTIFLELAQMWSQLK